MNNDVNNSISPDACKVPGASPDTEIDNLVALIDMMTESGTSRLKVKVTDEMEEGTYKKEYHHGRCDINSPWACGASFDVLE